MGIAVVVVRHLLGPGASEAASSQPRQHVPRDLFNLRISPCQPVSPVGRTRRDHRRSCLVRVGTQHRVAVTDALNRPGLAGPEHA